MCLTDVKFSGWPHIVRAQQFSREWIENVLFPLSQKMEEIILTKFCCHLLEGKEMISLFCAESTRTRASFEIAMQKLGGKITFSAPNARFSSAMGKEESFEDTVRAISEYGADVFVIRNDGSEAIADIVDLCKIPIINAADNAEKDKQHPTQALLDLYTIQRNLGEIDGISVAMIGDLKNGRTVRSLCYLLAKWKIKHIYFVSPIEFCIGNDIKKYLEERNISFSECADIREIASEVDVFYQTRTQKNLGSNLWSRTDSNSGVFTIIDKEVLKIAKKDSIIMHPLPCLDEIVRTEVDSDPRAIYIESKRGRPSQVRCGLITRMTELVIVISPELCNTLI
jgi:aspartate carbamoyltransferase catalytic subunit